MHNHKNPTGHGQYLIMILVWVYTHQTHFCFCSGPSFSSQSTSLSLSHSIKQTTSQLERVSTNHPGSQSVSLPVCLLDVFSCQSATKSTSQTLKLSCLCLPGEIYTLQNVSQMPVTIHSILKNCRRLDETEKTKDRNKATLFPACLLSLKSFFGMTLGPYHKIAFLILKVKQDTYKYCKHISIRASRDSTLSSLSQLTHGLTVWT